MYRYGYTLLDVLICVSVGNAGHQLRNCCVNETYQSCSLCFFKYHKANPVKVTGTKSKVFCFFLNVVYFVQWAVFCFFFPKQYFDLIGVFSFLCFSGSKVEPVHHQTHIVGHIQPTLIFSGQTSENHLSFTVQTFICTFNTEDILILEKDVQTCAISVHGREMLL